MAAATRLGIGQTLKARFGSLYEAFLWIARTSRASHQSPDGEEVEKEKEKENKEEDDHEDEDEEDGEVIRNGRRRRRNRRHQLSNINLKASQVTPRVSKDQLINKLIEIVVEESYDGCSAMSLHVARQNIEDCIRDSVKLADESLGFQEFFKHFSDRKPSPTKQTWRPKERQTRARSASSPPSSLLLSSSRQRSSKTPSQGEPPDISNSPGPQKSGRKMQDANMLKSGIERIDSLPSEPSMSLPLPLRTRKASSRYGPSPRTDRNTRSWNADPALDQEQETQSEHFSGEAKEEKQTQPDLRLNSNDTYPLESLSSPSRTPAMEQEPSVSRPRHEEGLKANKLVQREAGTTNGKDSRRTPLGADAIRKQLHFSSPEVSEQDSSDAPTPSGVPQSRASSTTTESSKVHTSSDNDKHLSPTPLSDLFSLHPLPPAPAPAPTLPAASSPRGRFNNVRPLQSTETEDKTQTLLYPALSSEIVKQQAQRDQDKQERLLEQVKPEKQDKPEGRCKTQETVQKNVLFDSSYTKRIYETRIRVLMRLRSISLARILDQFEQMGFLQKATTTTTTTTTITSTCKNTNINATILTPSDIRRALHQLFPDLYRGEIVVFVRHMMHQVNATKGCVMDGTDGTQTCTIGDLTNFICS